MHSGARLSDSLSHLYIHFSTPTNTPAVSNCSALFMDETCNLFGTPSQVVVTWSAIDTLEVVLGSGFALRLNSSVSLRAGMIRDSTETSLYLGMTTVPILPPENPQQVQAVVSAPAVVGTCGVFRVDASGSTGYAGRALNFVFTVTNPLGNSTTTHTARSSLYIDAATLPAGMHAARVVVTNWLNSTDAMEVRFKKVNNVQPQVVTASHVLAVDPNLPLAIETRVSLPFCGSAGFSVRVRWAQILARNSSFVSGAASASVASFEINHRLLIAVPESMTLYIPPRTLLPGRVYGFNLFAEMLDPSGNPIQSGPANSSGFNTTFAVTASEPPVIASIDGGSLRRVPVLRSLPSNVTVDASTDSVDLAYPSDALQFTWTVTPVSPVGPSLHLAGAFFAPGGGKLLIPSALLLNATYRVDLIAVGASSSAVATLGAPRNASASQTLFVVETPAPIVVARKLGGPGKVHPGARVRVTADVTNLESGAVSYQWTTESGNLDLGDPANLKSRRDQRALVIAPSALVGGATYRLRATVTTARGQFGFAEIELVVNSAPTLGTCSSTPSTGVAVNTSFRLECSGWVDDDVPLQYMFWVGRTPLSGWLRRAHVTTVLPEPETGPNLTTTALVRDAMQAEAHFDFIVGVARSAATHPADLDAQIDAAITAGDDQLASALISGSASRLRVSESGGDRNTTYASSRRSRMIEWVSTIANRSSGSLFSSVSAPAGLLEQATQLNDPRGLSSAGRSGALSLLEVIAAKVEALNTSAYEPTVESSLATAANVLGSSAADAGRVEQESVATRVESVVDTLSKVQLRDAVEGEARKEVVAGALDLLTQKFAAENFGTAAVVLLDGAQVNLSQSVPLEDGAQFGSLVVASFRRNGYPSSYNNTGSLSVRVRGASGRELRVSGLDDQPVRLSVPTDYPGDRVTCMFWNTSEGNWSTRGVKTLGRLPGGGIACETTHLTTFTIAEGVSLEVNTFAGSDVRAGAFSTSNPVMVFTTGCILLYIVVLLLLARLDRAQLRDGQYNDELSERFWRKHNQMRLVKASGRSSDNCRLMVAWSMRTRHPWFSLCFRHPGDFLTYTKRCTVLIVLLFNMMTVCALLLGTQQSFGPVPTFIGAALVAVILSVPVPYFLHYTFRRSTPPEYRVPIAQSGLTAWCFTHCLIALSMVLGEVGEDGELDFDNQDENVDEDPANDPENDRLNESGEGGPRDEEEKVASTAVAQEELVQTHDEVQATKDEGGFSTREDGDNSAVQATTIAAATRAGAATAVIQMKQGRKRQNRLSFASPDKFILEELRRSSDGQSCYSSLRDSSGLSWTGDGLVSSKHMRDKGPLIQSDPKLLSGGTETLIGVTLDSKSKPGSAVFVHRACMTMSAGARKKRQKYLEKYPAKELCCCTIVDRRAKIVSTSVWTIQDVFAMSGALVALSGCWFVLVMLSYTLGWDFSMWAQGTLIAFGQDIVLRATQMALIQALIFLPCCTMCCCAARQDTPQTRDPDRVLATSAGVKESVVREMQTLYPRSLQCNLPTGRVGFTYKRLVVCHVDRSSPAESAGILPGARILAVNGARVSSDGQARHLFHTAHRTSEDLHLVFLPRNEYYVALCSGKIREAPAETKHRRSSRRASAILNKSLKLSLRSGPRRHAARKRARRNKGGDRTSWKSLSSLRSIEMSEMREGAGNDVIKGHVERMSREWAQGQSLSVSLSPRGLERKTLSTESKGRQSALGARGDGLQARQSGARPVVRLNTKRRPAPDNFEV